jgi:hypothetical protein
MLIAQAVALADQKNPSGNGVCLFGVTAYPASNQLPIPPVFKLIMRTRTPILEISAIQQEYRSDNNDGFYMEKSSKIFAVATCT